MSRKKATSFSRRKEGSVWLNCEDLIQDGWDWRLLQAGGCCCSVPVNSWRQGSWSPLAQPQTSGCVVVIDSVSKRRMGCWLVSSALVRASEPWAPGGLHPDLHCNPGLYHHIIQPDTSLVATATPRSLEWGGMTVSIGINVFVWPVGGLVIAWISQARILELIAMSFSRGPPQLWDQIQAWCIGRRVLYHWATRHCKSIRSRGSRGKRRGLCCRASHSPWQSFILSFGPEPSK